MAATGTNARPYRMKRRAASTAATREAILDAAVATLDPSAPLAEIARRAGVSQRTVLRHFGSRAGLVEATVAAADERIRRQRFAAPAGDLDAAVADLVRHYEELGDRVLARLAEEGRDERIDTVLAQGRAMHREWVAEKLGPLLGEDLAPRTRRRRLAQLVAICDVYTWKLLRRDSGLGAKETERAIAELIRGLIEGGDQP